MDASNNTATQRLLIVLAGALASCSAITLGNFINKIISLFSPAESPPFIYQFPAYPGTLALNESL